MEKINNIIDILFCLECKNDLVLQDSKLVCKNCGKEYPIVDNVARFVDEKYYNLNDINETIPEKTKNYFGYEWERFQDWGFIDEKTLSKEEQIDWYGGTIASRKAAFKSKCRLNESELQKSEFILDAGCGNGRYTYETGINTKNTVIGVDIGYGSVKSAYKNTKDLLNVVIIQASLFNLPFKNNSIDSCFSNGVLMHTGNAKKAFNEIASKIKPQGTFTAHLYHKLNPIWELNDWLLRKYTTKLSIEDGIKFAYKLSKFAKKINKIRFALRFLNLFFRLQSTLHHMFDWYSAPVASHHTYFEVDKWFKNNNLTIIETNKNKFYPFMLPWALNIKGKKQKK